jgi:flagellin
LSVNLERLSSGMRVNRASDDAAGLAISERLRAQVRGLNMGSRNTQDGISLIRTAEGWLQETTDVIQRIREISVQAANGVYTSEDRHYLQLEANQLLMEIDRIAYQAQFSDGSSQLLLDGTFGGQPPIPPGYEGRTGDAAAAVTTPAGSIPVDGMPEGNKLIVHIGANMDQRIFVKIDNMDTVSLGLAEGDRAARTWKISLSDEDAANQSIGTMDVALAIVNSQRATLGSFHNRLEHTMKGTDYAAENLQAAESLIRDTDMASEMVEFVKNQILSQTTASMLAQANLKPQLILRVIG